MSTLGSWLRESPVGWVFRFVTRRRAAGQDAQVFRLPVILLTTIAIATLGLTLEGAVCAADKSVTITWLCWGTPDIADRNERVVRAFYEKYPDSGIRIKTTVLGWNDYLQKVPVMVAGGSDVDIIAVEGTFMFPALAKGNALLDVSDVANKYKAELFPGQLERLTHDGRVLGVPMMGWESAPSLFIVYNQDRFDQAGLVPPDYDWTWDDLINIGKKLTSGDQASGQQKWAIDWGQTDFPWYWENAIHAFGGWMYNEDHTKSEVNSAAAVSAITLLNDLRVRYKISAPWGDWRAFEDGRSAMTARWDSEAQKLIDSVNFKTGVAIFPRGPAGHGFIVPTRVTPNGGAPHAMAVYRFSKYPQEAKRFLDFVVSDPAALRAEGTDWPWVPLRRNIPILIEQMKASPSWIKVFKAISAVQERIVRVDRAEGAGPEYQEVNQIMAENLRSFYLGKTSAQAAMENAKRQIDALLVRQAGQ